MDSRIMEFWKKVLNQQIKELENDIKIHKDILRHHVENIDELTVEIYKNEEDSLKVVFNRSSNKCENRLKMKPLKYSTESIKKRNEKQTNNKKNKNPTNKSEESNNKPNVRNNNIRNQHKNNQTGKQPDNNFNKGS